MLNLIFINTPHLQRCLERIEYQKNEKLARVTVGDTVPLEVRNAAGYYAAREAIEKQITKPIDVAFIKKINALVLGRENSDYRKIGAGVLRSSEVIYQGPIVDWVPSLMGKLLLWLNSNNELTPVLQAAVFHWQFVKIHPFCVDEENNGNGRTARLLTTLILRRAGFTQLLCYTLEDFFEKNKKEYYEALRGTSSCWVYDEDMTVWIEFFCDALLQSMKELQNHL